MHLATYLNDHLAGSAAALELVEHLERTHADMAPFLQRLHVDIEVDRQALEALIARLGATPSAARQAVAWAAEKFARLKMAVDDLGGSKLRLLESLEAVALGIHGKGLLWRAMKVVPAASGPDYETLIARADEQRGRVEAARLDAACRAFG